MIREHLKLVALGVFVAGSGVAGVLSWPSPSGRTAVEVVSVAPTSSAAMETPPPASFLPPTRAVTVEVFYPALAPYGEWILSEGYGRVWHPRVATLGWHPYARGHWIATDVGWVWASDEDWGERREAPFRYGRWSLDARVGWVWVPDVVWAPSWVTWRASDGWIGWAPLPGVYRWAGSSSEVEVKVGPEAFIFVPSAHFLDARPFMWRASPDVHAQVFVKTRPIVETVELEGVAVHVGPSVPHVAVVTGVAVSPVKIVPFVAARHAPGLGFVEGREDGRGAPGIPGASGGGHAPGGEGHAPGSGPHGPVRGGRPGGGHR